MPRCSQRTRTQVTGGMKAHGLFRARVHGIVASVPRKRPGRTGGGRPCHGLLCWSEVRSCLSSCERLKGGLKGQRKDSGGGERLRLGGAPAPFPHLSPGPPAPRPPTSLAAPAPPSQVSCSEVPILQQTQQEPLLCSCMFMHR